MEYSVRFADNQVLVSLDAALVDAEKLLAGVGTFRNGTCDCPLSSAGRFHSVTTETEGGRLKLSFSTPEGKPMNRTEMLICIECNLEAAAVTGGKGRQMEASAG